MAGKTQTPQGWREVRLGDMADVLDARRIPLNAEDRSKMPGEYPYYGANGVIDFIDRWIFDEDDDLVLLAEDGGHFDEFRNRPIAFRVEGKCWVNNHAHVLKATTCTVGGFLFHSLVNKDIRLYINGTTRSKLTQADLLQVEVSLPPLPVQRAIAAALDSIDDAIERTEAVIAATEQLRGSLLHQLLTRGVPGWHTEWRDVPGLGTIPADWDVVWLGDVIPKFEYGTSVRCSSEPVGMPILRIPNIASGNLNLSDLKFADLGPKESASVQLDAGDILLVRTNGNPDICGQCWVSDGLEGQWGFASYLVRGRADRSVINPWFIGHFLRSEVGRRLLKGNIRTSAGNYNLSVGGLGSMPLPCPPLNEQDSIVDTIRNLSRSIKLAGEEAASLRLLKESTADALLTGRVRIGQ